MTRILDKIKSLFIRFKGLTAIGFANIVGQGISGLFWLFIARLLGTANYGEVSYYIAIASIATTFSFLGSSSTLLIYPPKGIKIQSTVFFMSLISSIIASVALFLIFYNVGVSLYVIGNVILGLALYESLGLKLYKKYSWYTISQKILMVGLAIGLYYVFGVNGVILGIALSFFLSAGRIYQIFKEMKIDFSTIKSRFNFISNSYILEITRAFSGSTDKLIVAPMLGFGLLGNYQLGVQFLSLLTIVPSIVYSYTLPEDASGNPNTKLKKATILFSVVLAVLGITLSPMVLPVLFPKFKEAIEVIQIMSVAIIPITVNNVFISKLLARENSRIVLVGSGIYLAIQITTIIILGKLFGVNGVAVSYVLATTAEMTFLICINQRIKKRDQKI